MAYDEVSSDPEQGRAHFVQRSDELVAKQTAGLPVRDGFQSVEHSSQLIRHRFDLCGIVGPDCS